MDTALASGRSILEPAETGSVRHGGRFWHLLTEVTLLPHYQNLAMQTQYAPLTQISHYIFYSFLNPLCSKITTGRVISTG